MKKLMETYSQIVELDVDEDEETLLIKAQSYMGLGQEETAIEYVNKAIKLKPYDPMPYIMKGMLLQNCNKTEEALECYDEAYNLDSELITIISDEINR